MREYTCEITFVPKIYLLLLPFFLQLLYFVCRNAPDARHHQSSQLSNEYLMSKMRGWTAHRNLYCFCLVSRMLDWWGWFYILDRQGLTPLLPHVGWG